MRKEEQPKKGEDEVEQLLQAAQDQVLLSLSLNSHIARASASANNDLNLDLDLDLDLERRLQALKSSRHSAPSSDGVADDLSARFATLKAKSSSSSIAANAKELPLPPTASQDEDEDEEDQVEKLIQWAKDAARLDPSPPSDDDDEEESQIRPKRK